MQVRDGEEAPRSPLETVVVFGSVSLRPPPARMRICIADPAEAMTVLRDWDSFAKISQRVVGSARTLHSVFHNLAFLGC